MNACATVPHIQVPRRRRAPSIGGLRPGVPCPCPADGVMLAVGASPGQGTLQVAAEKSPPGTFAVVVIRPRKGGDGLKYTVPIAFLPKLGQINGAIQDPLGALQRGDGAAGSVHRRAEVARALTQN